MLNLKVMDPWEHYLVGASIMILGITGTIINSIILYRNYLKDSNKYPNSLVSNLCLTNLGIIFFAFPLSGLASFKQKWIWGDQWCTYYGSVSLLFGFNIMITTMMLVLDIFLRFYLGNYESYKIRARRLMIIWGWITSIFWSTAPLFGWSKISYEPTYTSCTVDLMHPDKAYITYIISCFVFCYVLPIGLMIFVRIRPRKNYEPVSKDINKSFQKIVIIIILFIIEWSPYATIYLWPVFADPNRIPISLAAAAPVFAKLSVVLTPLVFLNENDPNEDKINN
ncbi:visual pigment-like receptor peropsin [Brachionus plicatilis]|uniref:Visual pigment-like receptor peropsin n=1 Tax=Brachionus plicatilis TaxID=10195 RepID=A0A3M7R2C9_BRAPC|nr:visual pigment-like receptor peropsin [Brachionus plicatilis]